MATVIAFFYTILFESPILVFEKIIFQKNKKKSHYKSENNLNFNNKINNGNEITGIENPTYNGPYNG